MVKCWFMKMYNWSHQAGENLKGTAAAVATLLQTSIWCCACPTEHWRQAVKQSSGQVGTTVGLTWLTDSNLLQVDLLHIVKVFHAGDVEAISHPQVELLQLHITQQLVEPLSILVHHHDLGTLATQGQRSLFQYPIYLFVYVQRCEYTGCVSLCFTKEWHPKLQKHHPRLELVRLAGRSARRGQRSVFQYLAALHL